MALAASGASFFATAAAANNTGATGRGDGEAFVYVALGDSTGAGYGARAGGYVERLHSRLRAERPQARLKSLCVNGATSADVLRRQVPSAVATHRPSLITLQVGVNDLSRQVSLADYARHYDAILSALVQTGAPIIVANLPDVSLAPVVPAFLRTEIAGRIQAFNKEIAAAARRHGVTMVDIYGPSHAAIPSRPELFSADGFHPSDAGYEFWADHMWPAIKGTLL